MATIHANSAEKALHRFANLVMRSHAQSTFSDTEAEIAEVVYFVVPVERQPGRRVVREVLALRGYDRDAKRFLIEPVFDVQHATASAHSAAPVAADLLTNSAQKDSLIPLYRLSRRKQIIEQHFDAISGEEDWSLRYNIAPTQPQQPAT
jgi:hypothetical protein